MLLMTAAPSRRSRLLPSATLTVTRPGTAPTMRPSSDAKLAVMRVPDGSAASTTTVIAPSAAMILLRAGNPQRSARVPGGISDITTPSRRSCR